VRANVYYFKEGIFNHGEIETLELEFKVIEEAK
jgi:hypothetical protein